MKKAFIYDFETLGQDPETSAVVSLATLEFCEEKFVEGEGYDPLELLASTRYIKFSVADQIKRLNKKIEASTLEWWEGQGEKAREALKPSRDDVSVADLDEWLKAGYDMPSFDKVFTRGNTFDPMFLKALIGHEPYQWWTIRDTRSYIDGMLVGSDISNKFIPDAIKDLFVEHDPRWDVVADVMRMQQLHRMILL